MYTIESETVFRKLTILGQLCRLNIDHWLRIVFLNRLCSFDANNMKQKGFITHSQHIWKVRALECLGSIKEGQYLSR